MNVGVEGGVPVFHQHPFFFLIALIEQFIELIDGLFVIVLGISFEDGFVNHVDDVCLCDLCLLLGDDALGAEDVVPFSVFVVVVGHGCDVLMRVLRDEKKRKGDGK